MCKKFPEILQKCEELQKWLSSCSSDTEDNVYSEKFDELEGLVKKCTAKP